MIIALPLGLLYTEIMGPWGKCIILVFSIFLFSGLSQGQEELPFWRKKEKLYKKVLEQRKIVVSVKFESEKRKRHIRMMGAGVVNVPIYFAVEQVMRFEELPKVSSYFKKVVHKKDKKEVYFFMKALGTQVRILKTYRWGVQRPGEAQMDWIVTWGALKGMTGHYKFRRVGSAQTELSIWISMKKFDLPLPEFLMNFTLEVIAEKVAQKMRSFMEGNYRQAQQVRKDYVKRR